MKVTALSIPDILCFEPRVFTDHRGYFFESFNQQTFNTLSDLDIQFVQDNHSFSTRHVLRGLHYQLPPNSQGKLIRVVSGEIFDVVVDIRKQSSTFGKWLGKTLSAKNRKQLWIPSGFAHGFLVLSYHAEIVYKTTDFYAAESERSIRWDDPSLSIDWPLKTQPILSEKDANAPLSDQISEWL